MRMQFDHVHVVVQMVDGIIVGDHHAGAQFNSV